MGLWVTALESELSNFRNHHGLEGLFEALPAHAAILDASGLILRTNPAWDAFGDANGAQVGPGINYLAVCDYVTGPEASQARTFATGVRRVLRGELSRFSMDYACHSPTKKRWFVAYVTPLQGRVPRVLVTHWDVTGHALAQEARELAARRTAETALRHAQEQNRLLSQTMLQGLIYQDARGQITSVNPAAERILGLSQAELQALNPSDVAALFIREDGSSVPLEHHPAMVALRTGYFQNPITLGVYNPQDKGYRWISISAVPLFFEGEELPCEAYSIFEDVTERKQVEQKLRLGRWQMRVFVEQAPLMVAMLDMEMNYIAASRQWLECFGEGQDNLKGVNHYRLHPDQPAHWKQAYSLALSGRTQRCEEDKWRRVDGTIIWLRWVVQPWRNDNNQIGGIIISAEDISTRRQAEEVLRMAHSELELRVQERTAQLQERNQALAAEIQHHLWTELALRGSESRFRLLAENSTDMIGRFSPEGICLYISPSCRSLLGFEPQELLGTLAYDFFHPEEVRELGATHRFLVAEPRVVTVTARVRRKDGTYAWHETTCRSIFQEGKIQEFQSTSRDITERKGFEEALKENEARMRTLSNNLPDGAIFQFTRKANGESQYGYASGGIRHLFGIPEDRDLNNEAMWEELIHPDDRASLEEARREAARTLSTFDFEGRVVPPGAGVKWMHWRAAPRRMENGDVVWDGVMTEITKRKLGEEALRRAYRALRVLKECDEALVRATEETELLERVCRIIVEIGGAKMAWVGWAENNDKKIVRPVVSIGTDKGYLKAARISWGENAQGRGPTGTAIRTRKVTASHELSIPRQGGWFSQQQKWGIHSSVALPLVLEDRCIGALTIHSADPDAFKGEEIELFKQLAADLDFGISSLRIRAEREKLQQEILRISEREKQRFAQELHDGLCQHLTGTAMLGSVLYRRLAQRNDTEAEAVKQICDLLKVGADEARGLAHGLHPVRPEPEGLMDALSALARTSTKLFPVVCTFKCEEPVCLENQTAANHLFRIAQEALNNAMKHGQAKKVTLELKKTPQEIMLLIRDNGIGIPKDLTASKGMGMQIMKHRATAVGARLKVARAGKRGTTVSCALPVTTE